MLGFDTTFLILGIVLTLLNILDQLLKKIHKSPTNYIRRKIMNNTKKIEESLKSCEASIKSGIPSTVPFEDIDIDDLVDNLIDLSQKLDFKFNKN